jgi:site-specific DNA-adenine methylase
MKVPHPIPYQGSMRNLAPAILGYFPTEVAALIEPFAGSAAITLAAASCGEAERFVIADVNQPLVELWRAIIESPEKLARQYESLWRPQHDDRLRHVELHADRSSQATLLGRAEITIESLYLSPALAESLNLAGVTRAIPC